ncbi:uncharacterized protein LOC135085659 isoform X2 [Ostrinia nubilalis]|uniref:uncharacterized protein LOC135085659 isoform X2 n=1 Tax=Ostrinia nubilalis TaxID=29057 RepID=UPI0030823931
MDCKVPVMFTYLGITIIFSTFGHAYAETTVFYIDSIIKNQLTKCGNDIIVPEGDTMKLTFQSPSRYVNLAFCNNESTKNLNAKLNISNGHTITFDIFGREEYEGLWNCSFLTYIGHYVRDSVTYNWEYYAPYANCSLMVRIQRDVTLTVSSTTTTNLVAAKATDKGYYRFIEGNKITFECKKGHTNGEFLQSGYLVLKFCWKDKSCADLKRNLTVVRDTMELNSTFDESILHCIYNNSVGYQTDAAIVLQIKAQSRPEITVEGLAIREPRSSESKHTFDGTVNQTLELVCTNNENWGNIHWEVCNGSGLNCKSQTLASDKTLKINFTLSADKKNTTVKCVHTFNALREETPVFLYANEPPVLTTKNDMILNYTRGTDTYEYVTEREDKETIRIKCKSRENSGSLSWRDCNNAAQKSCNQTQDIYNRSIEKVIPWNSEKIEVFFYCVYKNSRNYNVSSKVNIVVHPSMSTRSVRSVDETTVIQMSSDSESSTDIIFEGKIGERRSYDCKIKHWKETSTVHWEFCDEYGLNCSCSDARFERLSQNITLAEGSNGTIAKCVLSFHYDDSTYEKTIRLYAYHPPKLTNKDGVEFQSYNSDYVVEGTDGENIIIRCFNRQYTGVLFWRTSSDTTSKLCETEDGTKCNMIEKSFWLKPDLNGTLLYCVFKTDRGHEIATKATFVIHPKTQINAAEATTARFGQTPKETSKSSNSSPTKSPDVVTPPRSASSATSSKATTTVSTPITTKQTQKATSNTTPSKSSTKTAPASGAPSKGESTTILNIKKNGDKASSFTNGEKLCFSCYDTKIDAKKCIIKLITPGQEVEVPVVKENEKINHRNSYSGYLEMNFTSTDVEVKCLIFGNASDEKPSTSKLLILKRKNPDFEPEGNPDLNNTILAFLKAEWMWVALGGGVLMLLIVITATVRAFRKGKREEAMVQRASVNYESFTNEPQEPTPPFPQGPKLEQTYLAPIDLQESPYATSRPENDTYALPYTPSNVEELYSKPVPKRSRINELYTKVLPKSLRKQQESSKYVNSAELTYAEISHTGPSKKPVAHKQIQKEDNYAAVVHNNYVNVNKDTKYGKARNDGYSEVVPNTTYANVTNDVYVEPSYCELGRHK